MGRKPLGFREIHVWIAHGASHGLREPHIDMASQRLPRPDRTSQSLSYCSRFARAKHVSHPAGDGVSLARCEAGVVAVLSRR